MEKPPEGSPDNSPALRLAWDDYRLHQKFEHQLIDRKTSWLLTTQGLLFAAYGVTLGDGRGTDPGAQQPSAQMQDLAEKFQQVVPWTGLSIASITFIGVLAVICGKCRAWKDYRSLISVPPVFLPPSAWKRSTREGIYWGVRTWLTVASLVPDLLLPIVFIVMWRIVAI